MPLSIYLSKFVVLLVAPFENLGRHWLILPIYTSLILGELYRTKVGFGHAVGNGFVMLWAGISWAMHLSQKGLLGFRTLPWVVTACCLAIGVFAILLGLRKKDKALCEILGHTRFSCYFLITLYPMQAGMLDWTWPRLASVLIFALPSWLLIYLMGRLGRQWLG